MTPQTVAPGVAYLTIGFVNVFFAGERGAPWTLVDTGLPGTAGFLQSMAERWHGTKARPGAIILTHGHFDHAGSVNLLAEQWDIPVYAHPLELPFLTGKSDYPPLDPTVGGAIGFASRFLPSHGYNLGDRVHPLPADGTVPGMPGWRWVHTPGHSPGHIALFREEDRVLIAGDAIATINMESFVDQITERRKIVGPPPPITPDWQSARTSVHRLAELEPSLVAAGHGIPMTDADFGARLTLLWERLTPPPGGRYAQIPARSTPEGIVSVPPPVPDPLPKRLAAAGAIAIAIALIVRMRRRA